MTHKSTEERRAQISHAFLSVMAERGYAKASIAKIAQKAGLSPGLVHYHFKNKQAILLDVFERLMRAQMAQLDRVLEPPEDSRDAIQTLLDTFLSVGDSANPDALSAWVSISAEAIRQPEVREAFQEAIDAIGARIEDIIERGVAQGEFELRGGSVAAASAAIIALIQGYFTLAATHPDAIPRGSAAASARRMCAGLL